MSFLDKIKGAFKPAEEKKESEEKSFNYDVIPTTIEDFKALAEAASKDEFAVIALTVIAFNIFPANADLSYDMLNVLKGPAPLSAQEKAFIKDQLRDKDYLPRSYFAGATPENNYEPTEPFTITVKSNPYSRDAEGYFTAYITSGGADNPRPITVRLKPSTGEWFLHNFSGFLPGIRVPAAKDPWA